MPYVSPICGIYEIETPRGSKYIGSSHNIKQRWSGHKCKLRRGRHENHILQLAYNKYKAELVFRIVELCATDQLVEREQYYLSRVRRSMNVAKTVNNAWTDRGYRERMRRLHQSAEWKSARSEIAKRIGAKRAVAIETDDGREFASLAVAAEALGLRPSGVRALALTQRAHRRLRIRLKRKADPWFAPTSAAEQQTATRRARGVLRHSEETRAKMRVNRRDRRLSEEALRRAIEANKRAVIAVSATTGAQCEFQSIKAAVVGLALADRHSAGPQITKACRGIKKTAYGYRWRYAA
jgi:group I intron endonuclease